MSPRRAWRLDVAACCLLAAGLLVALTVFSYDPADVPDVAYPTPATPRNLLGHPGAWLGNALVRSLGLAVYALLASWFVLVVLLLLRHGCLTWVRRFLGWLLLIPAVAVLADRCSLAWPPGALVSSGGSLGAWLALWLELHLQRPAWLAVLAGSLFLGVVLALDVLLFRLLLALGWCLRGGLLALWRLRPWELLFPGGSSPAPSTPRPSSAPAAVPAPGVAEEEEPEPEAASPEPAEEPEPQGPAPAPRSIPIHHHDAVAAVANATHAPVQTDRERFADFELPPLTLLEDAQPFSYAEQDQLLHERAVLLEKTFTDFGLKVNVVGINTGPVVTQFEIALETGLRINKVTRLADDVALCLKAASVRMVAPIPGKNTVGIEVPNELRADVRLKEVILASGKKAAKSKIPLFLGKDSEGRPLVHDLAEMPHLLIAGTTGTGKSVCMNAIILSMLVTRRPDEVKMIMIDPKWTEMSAYGRIPHLMHPVVKDMKKAEAILAWAVDKMEERYELLSRARVRNIVAYNELGTQEVLRRVAPADEEERRGIPPYMPYIVIFIDEMADLILMMKKQVEEHIIRLAQKSRAAGIHLVVATQKPTVDVITGLIKSNLPARICFKVNSKSDSRVVLDEMGADKLLGKGDLLFLPPGTSNLVRAQGAYASDKEIEQVVGFLDCDPCFEAELVRLKATDQEGDSGDFGERLRSRDKMYEAAIDLVVREGRGSVSLLQRTLGIGYGRAARLIDFMAEDGIVGAYNGSSAREVLYTPEQWAQMRSREAG